MDATDVATIVGGACGALALALQLIDHRRRTEEVRAHRPRLVLSASWEGGSEAHLRIDVAGEGARAVEVERTGLAVLADGAVHRLGFTEHVAGHALPAMSGPWEPVRQSVAAHDLVRALVERFGARRFVLAPYAAGSTDGCWCGPPFELDATNWAPDPQAPVYTRPQLAWVGDAIQVPRRFAAGYPVWPLQRRRPQPAPLERTIR
jgi:hypothetical protein